MGEEILDAFRADITIKNLIKRYFFNRFEPGEKSWFAGIFLGFDGFWFRNLNGFDENFFMYVEDCDICQRSNALGGKLVHSEYAAIHDERRHSLVRGIHFRWHIKSLFYYLIVKKLKKVGAPNR
ncbi:hypothetical protein N9W83_06280 [Planktomarina temperata]|nr:hypothetical protein [Planktomarina temperata]